MMNVLDLRTYNTVNGESDKAGLDLLEKHDVNNIPAIERYEMAYARGRCWDLLFWFFSAYEIFNQDDGEGIDGCSEIAMSYLWHQSQTIIKCKKMALKSGLDDGTWFTLKSLERQMKLCLDDYNITKTMFAAVDPDMAISLAFPDPHRYGVRKLAEAKHYGGK